MSDLVGNPEDRFSRVEAQIICDCKRHVAVLSKLVDFIHKRPCRIMVCMYHYENLPMQYTEKFFGCKNEIFQWTNFNIFLIFAQNIDCGYTLEPPRRGGSNEYPQSMFWSKNKKNKYTPAYPSFAI